MKIRMTEQQMLLFCYVSSFMGISASCAFSFARLFV